MPKVATRVTSVEVLNDACGLLRPLGVKLSPPRSTSRRLTNGQLAEGYAVRFEESAQAWKPWSSDVFFVCDESGTMEYDNHSDYFDRRERDKYGNRLNGTGPVHEQVLLYERTNGAQGRRAGADGRWGDIRYLDALLTAYAICRYQRVAERLGNMTELQWPSANAVAVLSVAFITKPFMFSLIIRQGGIAHYTDETSLLLQFAPYLEDDVTENKEAVTTGGDLSRT